MTNDTAHSGPTFADAFKVWTRIGLTSFGGPAGQIALMHKILVEEKNWLDERTYLLALNFCTLLPGPEAMQLATYSGWRLHGVKGGLAAGLMFVLPGAALILLLAMLYAAFGSVPFVSAIFTGIKAAVLAIVIEALIKISKRALQDTTAYLIAALSFAAIFLLQVPFPVIVLAAGIFGYLRGMSHTHAGVTSALPAPVAISQTLGTIALWLAIWTLPLACIGVIFGGDHVLSKLAVFFSTLAIVTFGGAYAVLAYMAQEAVMTHGWLDAGDMLNGLGLAETTPGPLILVTEFVGYLAAYRADSAQSIGMGMLGAAVTLWATFAPCFLYVFAGAPYIEGLKSAPRLGAALSAITAAVVGVILNLSVWFALHVLFRTVETVRLGPLQLSIPDAASLDVTAAAIVVVASVLLFRLHAGIMTTLAVCGALGLAAALVV